MRTIVRARWLVLVATAAVTLSACGGGGAAGPAGPGGDRMQVGFSAFGLHASFLTALSDQVAAVGQQQNVEVVQTNSESDPAKQNNDINTMVTSGVKGLLIDPVSAESVVPAIERADAAGVKVVAIDGSAAGGPVAMQVATDNTAGGAQGCAVLGEALGGRGTVLNLQGDLSNLAGRNRDEGFTGCMSQRYPGITLVSKPMNFDPTQCSQIAQTQLTSAQIDGIFSAAGLCLPAVSQVLKSQNRLVPVGQPGHVPFVELDGTPEDLDAVRQGILDATISQPLREIAQYGMYWVTRAIRGEPIAAGPTDHDTQVVEVDGTLRDLLAPTTVTKANVDDPALWANAKKG